MIYLASESPRRRELMNFLGREFIAESSPCDEDSVTHEDPQTCARFKAEAKAQAFLESRIHTMSTDDVIIASDTVVCTNNEILGKPQDTKDCIRMLRLLSGAEHEVHTAVSLLTPHKALQSFVETARVRMYDLTDEEICAYANTQEPYDKAGSYAVQGAGALLIKEIHGDFYTIMGLPIARLSRELEQYRVSDCKK